MLASENATRMNPAGYTIGSPALDYLLSAMDILLGGPWEPEPEKDWQEEARRARAEIAARKEAAEATRESTKGKTKKVAPRTSLDEVAGYPTTTDDKLGWGNAWVRSNSLTKALEKRRCRKPIRVPSGCRPGRFQGFRRYQHDYATPAPERASEPTGDPEAIVLATSQRADIKEAGEKLAGIRDKRLRNHGYETQDWFMNTACYIKEIIAEGGNPGFDPLP